MSFNRIPIIGAAAIPPSLVYVGTVGSPSGTQDHTFNAVNLGTPGPTRRLIVVVAWSNSTAHRTISSFTRDGVAMPAAHVSVVGSTQIGGDIAIYSLLAPTGTSSTFQVNFSGTLVNCQLSIFNAFDETTGSFHAVMTANTANSATQSGNINIPNNGWVLAVANIGGLSVTGITWVGATEVAGGTHGSGANPRHSRATASLLPTQSGRPISATAVGGSNFNGALAAMSWG